MQGSVRKGYGGSKTPAAEYNVAANVPAAQKVLSAPWRQHRHHAAGHLRPGHALRRSVPAAEGEPGSAWPGRCWRTTASGRESKRLDELHASSVLFDTVAVYLAYPDARPLVKLETLPIAVTRDGFTRIDAGGTSDGVAADWTDLDAYRDLVVTTLDRQLPTSQRFWVVYRSRRAIRRPWRQGM